MKKIPSAFRIAALLASLAMGVSCSTTYDAYGAPRQSVDPAVAIAGVAAAGLVGYALAQDNNPNCNRTTFHHSTNVHYSRPIYRPQPIYGYGYNNFHPGHGGFCY